MKAPNAGGAELPEVRREVGDARVEEPCAGGVGRRREDVALGVLEEQLERVARAGRLVEALRPARAGPAWPGPAGARRPAPPGPVPSRRTRLAQPAKPAAKTAISSSESSGLTTTAAGRPAGQPGGDGRCAGVQPLQRVLEGVRASQGRPATRAARGPSAAHVDQVPVERRGPPRATPRRRRRPPRAAGSAAARRSRGRPRGRPRSPAAGRWSSARGRALHRSAAPRASRAGGPAGRVAGCTGTPSGPARRRASAGRRHVCLGDQAASGERRRAATRRSSSAATARRRSSLSSGHRQEEPGGQIVLQLDQLVGRAAQRPERVLEARGVQCRRARGGQRRGGRDDDPLVRIVEEPAPRAAPARRPPRSTRIARRDRMQHGARRRAGRWRAGRRPRPRGGRAGPWAPRAPAPCSTSRSCAAACTRCGSLCPDEVYRYTTSPAATGRARRTTTSPRQSSTRSTRPTSTPRWPPRPPLRTSQWRPSRCAVVNEREKDCSRLSIHSGPHGVPRRVDERLVERLAVDRRRDAHVRSVLHPALDLERRHPGRQQLRQHGDRGEVGRRKTRVRSSSAGGSRRGVTAGSASGRPGCSGRGCRCARRPCSRAGSHPSTRSRGRRGRRPRARARARSSAAISPRLSSRARMARRKPRRASAAHCADECVFSCVLACSSRSG